MYTSLPIPEESGWNKSHDGYTFDWEAPEIQSRVQESVDFLMKGCSCKKDCRTANCGCRKRGIVDQLVCVKNAGSNLQTETPITNIDDEDTNSDSEEHETKNSDLDVEEYNVEEDIITEDFLDTCYDII